MLYKATLTTLVLALTACTNVFLQPGRTQQQTPDQLGLRFDDVYFSAADGTKLHGWWLPGEGKAIGTVLFLHGNAENISTHINNVAWMPKQHINVFLFDYRGYGMSSGTADLDGAITDTDSALQILALSPDATEHGIILFGQSLGGALATDVAVHTVFRDKLRAVILDSTFASYRQVAREKLSDTWLTWIFKWPISLLFVSDRHKPKAEVSELSPIPLLVIHGEEDDIVPIEHSEALYAAAKEPKQLWRVPKVKHIQALQIPEYRERFLRYVTDAFTDKE